VTDDRERLVSRSTASAVLQIMLLFISMEIQNVVNHLLPCKI
jgi:hypothetical protein